MTEHTHAPEGVAGMAVAAMNGSVQPADQPPPSNQISMPPAEVMMEQLQNRLGNMSIELFQWQSAASFQAELVRGLQEQVATLSRQLSECKGQLEADSGDSEPEPSDPVVSAESSENVED